jgi:molybdopterin/thiamine biosynthesis adenylyltransferase
VDPEITEVGNLVRHTLTLADTQKHKATALANRLNLINPHAKIHAICARFPSLQSEELRIIEASDVIIDCTASNDVLQALNVSAKNNDGTIFSFSIGFNSTRLYCFAAQKNKYNALSFHESFRPWQDQEVEEISSAGFPSEGIGCWHPVFPARADDIWLMASVTVKYMENVLTGIAKLPDFTVFVQERRSGLFTGLRRFTSSEFNGS